MKINSGILALFIFLFAACGPKMQSGANSGKTETACADTTGKLIFTNGSTTEVSFHVLRKESNRQGNTILNNWLKYKHFPVKPGDSISVNLTAGKDWMYDIYGPVSTNVNGQGVVSTGKFILKPCEIRRMTFTN